MPSPRKRSEPTPISITLFRGRSPYAAAERSGLPWHAFVAQLRALLAVCNADKLNLPALAGAAFDEGYRSNPTVGEHTCLFVDVDSAGRDPVAFVRRAVATCKCVVYESPSSTDDAPRFRVVVALAAPYPAHAAPDARSAFARALGLDPVRCGASKAAAPAQIFFAGRLEGTRERAMWVSSDDAPLWQPPKPGSAPDVGPPLHATDGELYPTRAATKIPDLASAVEAVAPDPDDATETRRGGREAMRALGGLLARLGYHPDAIAEAVETQIPSGQPGVRAEQAADAAEAYYSGDERTAGAEGLAKALGADVVAALREANGDDAWAQAAAATWAAPSHEPTPVELEAAEPHPTVDGAGLQCCGGTGWPWVVQFGTQFWLHDVEIPAYRSRAFAIAELEAALANHLSNVIPDEERTPAELRRAWVGVANTVRWTYTDRVCVYDPPGRALTVPILRWAPLVATRHAGIDAWLRALAGDDYPYLALWLAAAVALDRPAPCLYLIGGKGLGKSLLADGLAGLWSQPGPCKMLEATGNFNDTLADCPVVFSDEGFPEDFDFARFREAITARSVKVNRKYGAKGTVEGCVRYMLAANNDAALRYQRVGSLTQDDLEAIADRLLVLRCSTDARRALRALDTAWVARQGLAEHILWLASDVELEPSTERMCARPHGAEALLRKVVEGRTAAGRGSDVLLKLAEGVGAPEDLTASYGVWVRADAGEVWVQSTKLAQALREDGSRSTLADVREVCDTLTAAGQDQSVVKRAGKALHRVRVLSLPALRAMLAALE